MFLPTMLFQAARTILIILSFLQVAQSHPTTKVCPILGPSFPKPYNLNGTTAFKNAIKSLDQQINVALHSGTDRYGKGDFNKTTFSVGLFNVQDQGLLHQYHHTSASVANSPNGTHRVDQDTIYRIGSISKLMTMYTLLILDGDRSFNVPISHYLPQLAKPSEPVISSTGVLPLWSAITVGDLGSHEGGIVSDYGADDVEFFGRNPGLPPLPKNRIPTCGIHKCTREQELIGLKNIPAIFPGGATPSYSNAGYDLIGMVIESITGVPQERSFNDNLVKALGLQRAFFSVPKDSKYGAIPSGPYKGGWFVHYGPSNSDGGNSFSTLDLALVGKAIMNSTLLPVELTRRWLKPRTFTSDPMSSVGAPWEIFRWETPNRLYDMYTKDGGVGNYASMFILVPDLGFGYSILTTGNVFRPPIQFQLANVIASTMLPAVEDAAREQAHENFAGRYSSSKINSSVVITTDDQPGLRLTEWISNGTNIFLREFSAVDKVDYLDFRLWPNELYNGTKVGFTGTWQTLPRREKREPFGESCQTWGNAGYTLYGNVDLAAFVFELDPSSGKATRLRLEALSIVLEKES